MESHITGEIMKKKNCRLKRPAINGGFGKGIAEVNKEMESHITGEMIMKKKKGRK